MKTKSLSTGFLLYLISSLVAFSQGVDNKLVKEPGYFRQIVPDSTSVDTSNIKTQLLIENDSIQSDSLPFKTLTYQHDSTIKVRPSGTSLIKDKIIYDATDSTIFSVDGKKVYLFGDASIVYGDIELKAAYIEVDMDKNILYAEGVKDSLGKVTGEPVFKQGKENMQAKSITYNVKTEKGYITGLYTQQDDGYLQSKYTKKGPNNSIDLERGKYTTCDLEHPHFYLWLSRGKVIPDKAIVAGYSFLVIEDIPLYPLMIPFGFFPNTKEKASGFIIPKLGEERTRGFYLRDGGYYFAINDYVDLTVKGDVYSKGSWSISTQSKYKLRYKYSGSVDLGYSVIKSGESDLLNSSRPVQYHIRWTHTQDPKARPNSNFNANVNFTSSEDNRYNATSSEAYLTNTTSSSISFRKNFANTPFSTSINLRHNQNNKTHDVQLGLPQMTMNMSRIFPFRRKIPVGKTRWYENIGITYSGNFENKSDGLSDSTIFKPEMWDYFKNGIEHKVPLSTSLKVLKYFNLSPSINLTDRMYFKRTMHDITTYTTSDGVIKDTVVDNIQKGFYNVYDYSTSLSLGTTVYGMYGFKSKWLKAIRHVATPSVSLSYRPDFQESRWGYYYKDPKDTTGRNYYSPYYGSIYGVPGSGKSGNIGFSLNNNVEMKVHNKKDTTDTDTKIKLLDGLSFNTSYNIIADSMNWSPINISGRTTLFKVLSINMSAQANPYALDEDGNLINKFNYQVNPGQPFRITSARASTGFSVNSKTLFKKDKKGDTVDDEGQQTNTAGLYNQYSYDYFNIPWNVNVQYSLSYSKPGYEAKVTQSLSFSGDFSLTAKWKIGFNSGYDFEAKDFTYTSFNLSRDLHCWVATLSLVPFGPRQSYNFSIGARSSILSDLKYNKNKSWMDNAY